MVAAAKQDASALTLPCKQGREQSFSLPRKRGEEGVGVARAYAQFLLDSLGTTSLRQLEIPDEHPALTWARSGLMALTGVPSGEPQMCPVPIAACADGALGALASLAPPGAFEGLRGAELLAERAAITGYTRAGVVSPGGSCHLLETADGGIALNLARDDDWALLPAWLEADVAADWDAVTAAVRSRSATELTGRGRELGLAVARDEMSDCPHPCPPPFTGEGKGGGVPLVVDLSSLWAGPLCSRLLQRAGAEVIKVESAARPDGARFGPPAFFDRMNSGKRLVSLNFSSAEGRDELHRLLARADIVIEGSRPRALRQLGIHAEEFIEENPGLTWISLTGYGRGEPQENWIAYGDDAAIAAGLSHVQYLASGRQMIVGDAIADPLTGLHAALAAWTSWQNGGGRLVSLALHEVVAQVIHFDLPKDPETLRERQRAWTALAMDSSCCHPREGGDPV